MNEEGEIVHTEEIQSVNINQIAQAQRIDRITEQKYLDLAEDCKKIVEEKDKEIRILHNELVRYKATLYKIYGIINFVMSISVEIDLGHMTDSYVNSIDWVDAQIRDCLRINRRGQD